MIFDAFKVGVVVFIAAIAQTSVFSGISVLGGAPDILLVTLVSVALVRGATTGAVAGFFAGLVVDIALLATLGMTSLLLTLVGYWAGRYGETAPSGRRYAPYLAVAVMTVLFAVGSLVLRFMLGEPAPAQEVLVETLAQSLALNLLATWPIFAIVRRLLPRRPGVTTFGLEVSVVG
jgi:rod shape-determining protein MreD